MRLINHTGTFNSRDVATANTVTANTATLLNGANGGLASNYSIAAGGTAAANITRANLTITADDQIKLAGTPNPNLTLNYSGFAAGDNSSVLTTQPTLYTEATEDSAAGSYGISVSGAAAENYTITFVDGTLSVFSSVPRGYLGALAYVSNQDDFEDDRGDDTTAVELVDIQDGGIRLPSGVR